MAYVKKETEINGQSISFETGKLAKLANGSAVVRVGDTMVLATVCLGGETTSDFFPLSVEYNEKAYAAGKIPGGFFKREGRPGEKEILSARLVDRPIRPLFPAGYRNEVQVICSVLSADDVNDAGVLAITAASTALCLSDLPFSEPVAGVKVGMVDGKLKVFPTLSETESGELDLIIAGTAESIMMVEGGAAELPEETFIEAILLAHEEIKKLVTVQKEMMSTEGKQKLEFVRSEHDPELVSSVEELVKDKIHEASFKGVKQERYAAMGELKKQVKEALAEKFPESEGAISSIFSDFEKKDIRKTILESGTRIGGRGLDEVRQITCELDLLPRVHGSALFTRGETQTLAAATLGTKLDVQHIDSIQGAYDKSYMLHYNFPPYCVGEVKRFLSTSRREVGHGHLAERSISPVLPDEKSFPYTIRIVSEVLESNGSSSMATVCSASLSLMAGGVPIKSHVAGVAMGLVKEGDSTAILTDILGTEDHVGDMDFKVAGTREGITGIQMDIKIAGITPELMREALAKAKDARMKILGIMEEAVAASRKELSDYAPRISSIVIEKDKIREVIGPSGKMIRDIQEKTGTTLFIEDDGTIQIAATNRQQRDAAVERIKNIVAEPELNAVYEATIKTIVEFGAFAEYLPGKDGLIHISELAPERVAKVDDVVQVGDKVMVKLIGFDRFGKVKLSRKAML